ncbi:MAG TPA: bacterial transcriptional activator domain-containing protein [Trueperaceae bacterium]
MALLEFGLLGGFQFSDPSGTTAALGTSRPEKLLAYLLLKSGSPQPRRRLAYLFWPDSDESQAQTNLRRELHRLRRLLPQTEQLMLAEDHRLGVRPGAVECDVQLFERQLDLASSESSVKERLERLHQAVATYKGELLPEYYDDWVLEERERLQERFLGALERIVQLLEAAGELAEAIEHARRWQHLDPLSERAVATLVKLHSHNGDRALALSLLERYGSRLERDTGLGPGPELRALRKQLTGSR